MAAFTKTFHGTRAILSAHVSANAAPGQQALDLQKALGIFESIETGVTHDHFEPFILGRASAGEVVIMGQSPIMVRLSGFRKVDAGPYSIDGLTMNKLQEILNDGKEITIQVTDRQTGLNIMVVKSCKVVSHNFSVAAKQPARLSLELVGLVYEDEAGVQSEAGVPY